MKTEDPIIYFVSNNNGITLYRSDSTEVRGEYLHNIYSRAYGFGDTLKYHKKLKIYKASILDNYYVKIHDRRCFINSLVNKEKHYEESRTSKSKEN